MVSRSVHITTLTIGGQGAGGDPLPAVQAHAPVPQAPAPPPGTRAGVAVAPHPRHPKLGPGQECGQHEIVIIMVTWPSSPEPPS